MDDLISREAVLKLPRNITKNMWGEVVEETVDVADIKALPSAQPEIIRCKDCKHYYFADNRVEAEQCHVCGYWDFEDPKPDGFCSNAERRKDD